MSLKEYIPKAVKRTASTVVDALINVNLVEVVRRIPVRDQNPQKRVVFGPVSLSSSKYALSFIPMGNFNLTFLGYYSITLN
jgi:hypothetical protein